MQTAKRWYDRDERTGRGQGSRCAFPSPGRRAALTNQWKPRRLLADDHAIVIEGLSRLLEADFEIVGTAGDGRALLEAAQQLKPDVIVADLSMPLMDKLGLHTTADLTRHAIRSGLVPARPQEQSF